MNNKSPYIIRENIIRATRQFFYEMDFHEVIPQILNTALPLEANLYPFETTWKTRTGDRKLYLPHSPERSIKRMLARGVGNCFALGKSFRNLEQEGSQHLPEFLMLEWYRKEATYLDIMKDVKELLTFIHDYLENIGGPISPHIHGKWKTYSLIELFKTHSAIDLPSAIEDDELLFEAARKRGYIVEGATWGQLYDQIFVNEIEPHLTNEPVFIIDFPARISPLCTQRKDDSRFAERFEFYMGGMEIGNGNTENTDMQYVQKTFETEHKKTGYPIDEEFLKSLDMMSGTTYAGIGLGIDRLTMLLSGESTIQSIEPAGSDYLL